MASNPRKALAALLPSPIDVGSGCSVRPVTLGMFALLESIDSPLLEARPGVKTLELVPSLYILTHPAEESLTGGLLERAAAWADTVPVSILARIREAASRQVAAVLNVVPETQTVKKKDTNGYLAYWIEWAARAYGWTYRQIMWETPASALAVLWRQWRLAHGDDTAMPLETIERIDNAAKDNH